MYDDNSMDDENQDDETPTPTKTIPVIKSIKSVRSASSSKKNKGYKNDDDDESNNESKNQDEDYNIDDEDDNIEGFHGSQIIEGRNLKNILLALLISFIGYIVAMTSIKNYIPISEYAPHMKKFKNLIYVGIFYIIVYMCLEVF
jgi:hypothetical protein